jgi:DNA-binding NtrC family response regulator
MKSDIFKIRVTDPTRKTTLFVLDPSSRSHWTLGSHPECELPFPSSFQLPQKALTFECRASSEPPIASTLWMNLASPTASAPLRLRGLQVESAEVPLGIPFQLGDLELRADPRPRSSDHWPSLRLKQTDPLSRWKTRTDLGVDLLKKTRLAAETSLSAYIQGETGTGKELIAESLHQWSSRRGGPFVAINCGALPFHLAESELFGHTKGAFTGADQARVGALSQAHGGTLFLDEIADLSLDLQVKLLRFLENGEIRPLGSDRTTRVNVRVVCASHAPLSELVRDKRFRQDLYFRLTPITLRIPPLRERLEDIDLLARAFAERQGFALSRDALLQLRAHIWPGNVRELRHSIERACAYGRSGDLQLTGEDFAFLFDPEHLESSEHVHSKASENPPQLSFDSAERTLLVRTLRLTRGNRSEAARLLKISRSTIFSMIKRHQIRIKATG